MPITGNDPPMGGAEPHDHDFWKGAPCPVCTVFNPGQKWVFNDQADPPSMDAVLVTMTEADIIRDYYAYWCQQMERVGRSDLICEERCVEDFAVIHWAWKVD
jgi:hypothetical protein